MPAAILCDALADMAGTGRLLDLAPLAGRMVLAAPGLVNHCAARDDGTGRANHGYDHVPTCGPDGLPWKHTGRNSGEELACYYTLGPVWDAAGWVGRRRFQLLARQADDVAA